MKYLVTGGAGFIGSHIVDQLIQNGHEVIVLDNLSTGSLENINASCSFINIDLSLTPIKDLSQYFKEVNAVFHCAALPNVQFSIDYPYESNNSNVDTTIKILECMRQNNVTKIIYSSSSSVYGNCEYFPTNEKENIKPISPYALQKYIGEEYIYLYNKLYNINYVILRYFNVYGERMTSTGSYVSVLSHFYRSLKNNQPLNICNDGNQERDFVYVKDVANANILSLNNYANNSILNIGNGKSYSINTIANWLNAEKQYNETRIEPKITLADISLAKVKLNWQPKQDLKEWVLSFYGLS